MQDTLFLFPQIILLMVTAIGCLGAFVSAIRGLFAVRAKNRLKLIIAMQISKDVNLFRISEIAKMDHLTKDQIEAAMNQVLSNADRLSVVDRGLLISCIKQNTHRGSERFVKEMMSQAASNLARSIGAAKHSQSTPG